MATADTISKPHDKTSRLKPFAWMKRLANRKNSSSDRDRSPGKKPLNLSPKSKGSPSKGNGQVAVAPVADQPFVASSNGDETYAPPGIQTNGSYPSLPPATDEDQAPAENKSIAPTLETNPGTIHSEGDHHSKAGTSNTVGGGMSSISGGANSIFSSNNNSSHSLSTTLTTIQSAPSGHFLNQQLSQGGNTPQSGQHSSHQTQPSQSSSYFQHQYPTTPATPASAIPSHLNPHSHLPTTYRSATANNLLTDNASVLTLASSSNRQIRRNSLDTNASIRAIAPSSVWGGSRESLPLSVLSQATNEPPAATSSTAAMATSANAPPTSSSSSTTTATTTQQQSRPPSGMAGLLPAERASVYSSGGVAAPALSSERNSIYAGKDKSGIDGASLKGAQGQDGSSIRSGLMGHGRSESITGSIGGYSSPLASPREFSTEGENSL